MLNPRLRFDQIADRISRVASSWHISIFAVPILTRATTLKQQSRASIFATPRPAYAVFSFLIEPSLPRPIGGLDLNLNLNRRFSASWRILSADQSHTQAS
jgi:hypothetical protein